MINETIAGAVLGREGDYRGMVGVILLNGGMTGGFNVSVVWSDHCTNKYSQSSVILLNGRMEGAH